MANFTLDAGLMGMDIHGKTVGIMGTGYGKYVGSSISFPVE
jgi:lactate dehydrogenase-like 2-hydroxyacid dehydrogenase